MLHSLEGKEGRVSRARGASIGASRGRFGQGLASLAQTVGSVAKSLLARMRALQRRGGKPRRLELADTLALGGRRQLFVVICDNQRYLVGAGAESVGTIVALEPRLKPSEKAARGPHLVRERPRDAIRIISTEPVRRKSFQAISETGDLWQ